MLYARAEWEAVSRRREDNGLAARVRTSKIRMRLTHSVLHLSIKLPVSKINLESSQVSREKSRKFGLGGLRVPDFLNNFRLG